jgi:hypothetical protein
VPHADWAAVKNGLKTEFRASANALTRAVEVHVPALVVAWTRSQGVYESKLMVLEETFREPLMGMSAESLKREGFETFAQFRRYYVHRNRRLFEPMREVQAYRLRPYERGDLASVGLELVERLYQEHLPSPEDR